MGSPSYGACNALRLMCSSCPLYLQICCSFGVDVLEALAASCTAFASQPEWSFSHALDVASDAAVALTLMLAHGAVIMAQALVFGVAMNSQKNTLLALLIASNFTEIKGTVLKRFDPTKLMVLATQDIVERFHLFVVLFFVLVEEAVGTGSPTFSTRLMWQCGYVLLAEVVIDVTKHAVLGKFNDIRPGVYREFMKDLCERVTSAQSHSMHKLVGFHPFASAALFLRAALSYAALRWGSGGTTVEAGRLQSGLAGAKWTALGLVAWIALSAFTALLGFVVKRGAVSYLRVYEARRGRMRGAQARTKPAALPGASPKASGGVQPPSPKSKDA